MVNVSSWNMFHNPGFAFFHCFGREVLRCCGRRPEQARLVSNDEDDKFSQSTAISKVVRHVAPSTKLEGLRRRWQMGGMETF